MSSKPNLLASLMHALPDADWLDFLDHRSLKSMTTVSSQAQEFGSARLTARKLHYRQQLRLELAGAESELDHVLERLERLSLIQHTEEEWRAHNYLCGAKHHLENKIGLLRAKLAD
jgi:hypothetical protein